MDKITELTKVAKQLSDLSEICLGITKQVDLLSDSDFLEQQENCKNAYTLAQNTLHDMPKLFKSIKYVKHSSSVTRDQQLSALKRQKI